MTPPAPHPSSSPRAFFWYAVKTRGSLLFANMTWGLVTGIAMVQIGLSDWWALLMNVTVYSGSAQIAALPLMADKTAIGLLFLVGIILNLRFVIYAATLFPYFAHIPPFKRFCMGYFTTDMAYFHFLSAYQHPHKELRYQQEWFFYGTICSNWLSWQFSTITGILLAQFIDKKWSLDFAADLALIGVLLPGLKNRPIILSACVAGLVSWIAQPLPFRLGLLCAIIAGIVAGMFSITFMSKKPHVES